MTPDTIARAGALARWGTFLNAAIVLTHHAAAEARLVDAGGRRVVVHRLGAHAPIEEGIRRRAYGDRLTELHDLAGYPREWWER